MSKDWYGYGSAVQKKNRDRQAAKLQVLEQYSAERAEIQHLYATGALTKTKWMEQLEACERAKLRDLSEVTR